MKRIALILAAALALPVLATQPAQAIGMVDCSQMKWAVTSLCGGWKLPIRKGGIGTMPIRQHYR